MIFGRFFSKFRRPQQKTASKKRFAAKHAEPAVEAPKPQPREIYVFGRDRDTMLATKITSSHFIQACDRLRRDQSKPVDYQKLFSRMFTDFEGSIDPIWIHARKSFEAAKIKIEVEYEDPETRKATMHRVLERIFADVLAEKAKTAQQKKP